MKFKAFVHQAELPAKIQFMSKPAFTLVFLKPDVTTGYIASPVIPGCIPQERSPDNFAECDRIGVIQLSSSTDYRQYCVNIKASCAQVHLDKTDP